MDNNPKSFDVSSLTVDGQALATTTLGPDFTPIVVVRESATSFIALSRLCTHAGCTVGAPSGGVMVCPCHGSRYDVFGRVTQGPAERNLRRFTAQFDASTKKVTVTFA